MFTIRFKWSVLTTRTAESVTVRSSLLIMLIQRHLTTWTRTMPLTTTQSFLEEKKSKWLTRKHLRSLGVESSFILRLIAKQFIDTIKYLKTLTQRHFTMTV